MNYFELFYRGKPHRGKAPLVWLLEIMHTDKPEDWTRAAEIGQWVVTLNESQPALNESQPAVQRFKTQEFGQVTVKRRPRKRGFTLASKPLGFEVIMGASQSIKNLEAWLGTQRKWLAKQAKTHKPLQKIESGARLPFLGGLVSLQVRSTQLQARPTQKENFHWEEGHLILESPFEKQGPLLKLVHKAFKQKAIEVLTERLRAWEVQTGLYCKGVEFKNVESFWGSCSSDQVISLNWKLLVFPMEVIDYIVVHELSHLVYMSHGPRFWKLVEKQIPDYKARIKTLRAESFKAAFLDKSLFRKK